MKLSDRIRAAMARHAEGRSIEDWRPVNDELSRLWNEAYPVLLAAGLNPHCGNEEMAKHLEAMGL